MKLTSFATALLIGCTLSACNENQPPQAQTPPPARGNALYQALRDGNTTYSSNVANQQPAHHELQLPGGAATPAEGGGRGAGAAAEPAVQIPQGARWTR